MKTYLVGTGLCILSGVIVLIAGIANLSKEFAYLAIPTVVIGFGLQMYATWKNRPPTRKLK